MVFHKSIPEGGKHFAGERLELIYGSRLDDLFELSTGFAATYNIRHQLFIAGYHNDAYYYILEQLEYYFACRNKYGPHRASALVKIWLANRKDFLFFRGNDLFLSKEPLTLCP